MICHRYRCQVRVFQQLPGQLHPLGDDPIRVLTSDGEVRVIPADSVVTCVGMVPRRELLPASTVLPMMCASLATVLPPEGSAKPPIKATLPAVSSDKNTEKTKRHIVKYTFPNNHLKENDIVPNATIYPWDLPYALQCKGGFGNRKLADWFLEYATVLPDHFGADVPIWATFNEPIAIYVGYHMGIFAPGLHDMDTGWAFRIQKPS